ncbi:hypothetical protein [Fusobacterium ulcerans]|uniref:hypothetical protein n=1 Tax=Fusobacterium ulcerans TaxID=861 RepID=UPI003FEFC1BA
MAKRERVDKRKTREPLVKIKFLVEGKTEFYYFKNLLMELHYKYHIDDYKYHIDDYKYHIDVKDITGGGYKTFADDIEKNGSTYDIVIIIADLDRAEAHSHEIPALERLIRILEKANIKNNIFLTYKNIESWFLETIPVAINNLHRELGYNDSLKGKSDIYQKLKIKNSDFDLGKSKFPINNLYYLKQDFYTGKTNRENISKKQSNLIYFKEYLKLLGGLGLE